MGTVFIIIGLPIIAYALLRAYQMYLMHQQLEKVLEERKLLIEEGVTDLPPLEVRGDMFGVLPRSARADRQAVDTAQDERPREVSPRREEPACAAPKPPRIRNLGILTQVGSILMLLGSLVFLAGVSAGQSDALIIGGIIIGLVGLLFFLIYAFTPREERKRLADERKATTDPFGNLKAGLILLAFAASSVAIGSISDFRYALPNGAGNLTEAITYGLGVLLGFLGLALILIHFVVWLSMLGKRSVPPPPAPMTPQDDTQVLSR